MQSLLMRMGQVESVIDDTDGLRIKARIIEDGLCNVEEIPYAFPLLPKTFQITPKNGECVLIFNIELNKTQSNRFYIGPILSQPQYYEKDPYDYGRGSSLSLLDNKGTAPLKAISLNPNTKGAFPNKEDVSLIGRQSEDIILKNGEIDLRCGIRQESIDSDNSMKGFILYNNIDPSYVQLKYKPNLVTEKFGDKDDGTNSVANIVADKINLISHQDENQFNLTDKENLITDEELTKILKTLHPAVYGDELIKLLQIMIKAITTLTIPYPGLPPCKTDAIQLLEQYDLTKIKSQFVRLS